MFVFPLGTFDFFLQFFWKMHFSVRPVLYGERVLDSSKMVIFGMKKNIVSIFELFLSEGIALFATYHSERQLSYKE